MVIVYRYIQITREGNHSIHAAKMFKSMKDIILKRGQEVHQEWEGWENHFKEMRKTFLFTIMTWD